MIPTSSSLSIDINAGIQTIRCYRFEVVAVILFLGGYCIGWFVRGGHLEPVPTPVTTPPMNLHNSANNATAGKEDESAYWQYPSDKGAGFAQAVPQHLGAFIIRDDLTTVAAWYGKRLGTPIPVGDAGAIGCGGGPSVFTAAGDDSFRPGPGNRVARTVRVGFGGRTSPASVIAVTLTRSDGDDRTPILVGFVWR